MTGPVRYLVLLAALLGFSWQSVLAETHRHAPSETASRTVAAEQDGHGQGSRRGAPADTPASCPICRELAHVNYYLPPAPLAFDAPRPVVAPVLAALPVARSISSRSHRWRSRAPPLLLQA